MQAGKKKPSATFVTEGFYLVPTAGFELAT
jgi:hypothetical protein